MLTLPTRGFNQLHEDYLLHNSRGVYHCALNLWGSPLMILYFIGDLFEKLNSRGSSFDDLWSTEGCS